MKTGNVVVIGDRDKSDFGEAGHKRHIGMY